jgi:hypothetical protein
MWTSHKLHKTKHQIHKLLYFKDLLHIAKKLHEVNSLLVEINLNISENVILPKCSTLVVIRYICERGGAAIHGKEAKKKNQVDQFGARMIQQVQFGQISSDNQFRHVRTFIKI